jgi:hypothetical protein
MVIDTVSALPRGAIQRPPASNTRVNNDEPFHAANREPPAECDRTEPEASVPLPPRSIWPRVFPGL